MQMRYFNYIFLLISIPVGVSAQSNSWSYIVNTVPTKAINDISELNNANSNTTVQYFDGLGRPIEVVQVKSTPNSHDLVTYQEYDDFGRESNVWLPVVKKNNDGAFVNFSTFKSAATETYNSTAYNPIADELPFSKPVYEASPLNRVLEQYGPGQNWHNNGKSVKTGYLTNKAKSTLSLAVADSLVCALIQHSGTLTFSYTKNYAAGELYVTRIKDENDNTSYEFKDKLGQVVLTRQINGSQVLDTYYVYDDFGNLAAVFPPMASDLIYNDKSQLNASSNVRVNYAYLYIYDYRNRCIQKKLPGADWIYYVYDKADQLIFSQDGEQRARKTGTKSEWTFNKYDAFGRLIISGIYKTDISHANLQAKYKDVVFKEEAGAGSYGYSWNTLKTTDLENVNSDVLLVNYYDDVNNLLNLGTHTNYKELLAYNTESGYGVQHTNSKGLLVATRVKNIDSNGKSENTRKGEIATAMYYDNRGRVIQTKSTNHLGGVDKEYIAYDFVGNPTQRKTVHSATGKTTQTEIYKYTYDHAGRLLTTTHQLNGGTVTTLAKNEYDELGRLKSNQKHTHANLKTNYSYNVRSWTKSISSPLFNQTLYYNDKVATHSYSDYVPQYNGNISGMEWQVQGESKRSNRFKYDALSRLTHSAYNGVTSGGSFNTSYNYDKHGNITQKYLNGLKATNSHSQVEALSMTYNGNQLKNIHNNNDGSPLADTEYFQDYSKDAAKTKVEYTYNSNGAMTKDLNKGINEIRYNSLNLPRQMDIMSPQGEARNEYLYSASGQKLQVVQRYNSNYNKAPVIGTAINVSALDKTKTTDYVGNKIYEGGLLKRILVDGGYYDATDKKYYFYLTDHLGNNRVVADQSGIAIQKTHYYPFGSAFAESENQGEQPYKYNGKELDKMHGLNMYDYSARHYDAAIGRFTTIDPHAENYYSWSPYHYVANNPLRYIDPNGMDYYLLRPDGRMILALKTEENYDRLLAFKEHEDGNVTFEGITVNDQSILPNFGRDKNGFTFAETSVGKDAFNIFKFASDYSDVEWGLDGFKTEGGNRYVLRTSFSDEGVGTKHGLYESSDMIFTIHMHPGGDDEKMASGRITPFGYEGGDMANLAKRYNRAKATDKKYPSEYPKHFIYHRKSQGLYFYNDKTTSKFIGKRTDAKSLMNSVFKYKNW